MIKSVNARLAQLRKEQNGSYDKGESLYNEGYCQVLSQSTGCFDILIEHYEEEFEVSIDESDGDLNYYLNGKKNQWDTLGIAALMQVKDALQDVRPRPALQVMFTR